jgi:Zn-dependent peptidase ImmA (M78 family)
VALELSQALGFPLEFFYAEDVERLESLQVSFRALSRLRARDRDSALAVADLAVLLDGWIDANFERPGLALPDFPQASPEEAAEAVRAAWGLGEAPIANMLHVVEAHGVRLYSLTAGLDLDAFAFWLDGRPFIMLNTTKSGERSRLDAAHELGHLVLHRHAAVALSKDTEREAQRFASALLMPRSAVRSMVKGNIDLASLVRLKHYWGTSAAAVAFRLHQLEIITEWNYRWLFRELSVRGWRSNEPEPIERERSQVLGKVFDALADEGVDRRRVAAILNIPLGDLQTLIFGLADVSSSGASSPAKGNTVNRPRLTLAPDP